MPFPSRLHLDCYGLAVLDTQLPPECNGSDDFENIVRVVGPPGDDDRTGDIPNPAGEAAGVAERPPVRRETLDPDPVEGLDFLPYRYAGRCEPDIEGSGIRLEPEDRTELLFVPVEAHVVFSFPETADDIPGQGISAAFRPEEPGVFHIFPVELLFPGIRERDVLAVRAHGPGDEALGLKGFKSPRGSLGAGPESIRYHLGRYKHRSAAAAHEGDRLQALEIFRLEHISKLGCLLFMGCLSD